MDDLVLKNGKDGNGLRKKKNLRKLSMHLEQYRLQAGTQYLFLDR